MSFAALGLPSPAKDSAEAWNGRRPGTSPTRLPRIPTRRDARHKPFRRRNRTRDHRARRHGQRAKRRSRVVARADASTEEELVELPSGRAIVRPTLPAGGRSCDESDDFEAVSASSSFPVETSEARGPLVQPEAAARNIVEVNKRPNVRRLVCMFLSVASGAGPFPLVRKGVGKAGPKSRRRPKE